MSCDFFCFFQSNPILTGYIAKSYPWFHKVFVKPDYKLKVLCLLKSCFAARANSVKHAIINTICSNIVLSVIKKNFYFNSGFLAYSIRYATSWFNLFFRSYM